MVFDRANLPRATFGFYDETVEDETLYNNCYGHCLSSCQLLTVQTVVQRYTSFFLNSMIMNSQEHINQWKSSHNEALFQLKPPTYFGILQRKFLCQTLTKPVVMKCGQPNIRDWWRIVWCIIKLMHRALETINLYIEWARKVFDRVINFRMMNIKRMWYMRM